MSPQHAATTETVLAEPKLVGGAHIYGFTGSLNCLGPAMLVSALKCGTLVPTVPGKDTTTPVFLAMNPFHAVPVLKDDGICVAESSTILRYLAEKYSPELYGNCPKRRAFVDWAMDRFATGMSGDCLKTIYVALGYATAPGDQAKVGKECTQNLAAFAEFFLREQFVGGERPSIADYKVAPFFYAYAHPLLREKYFVDVPARILHFNKAFAAECPAVLLCAAGGHSVKAMLDRAYGASPATLTAADFALPHTEDVLKHKPTAGKGKVQIYGVPVSPNVVGAVMLCRHARIGEMKFCMPGAPTRTKEFLEMNPFHAVPMLKDGDFCLAESNAILRYLATNYAPDYYPSAKRGVIDWAMDRFTMGMFDDVRETVYPCLGFAAMPEDAKVRKAHGEKACENLKSFADFFLQTKFVGGKDLSIADFRVAPAFSAYDHRVLREKFFLQIPARIARFNADFARAVEEAVVLTKADGMSLKEMLDKATAQPVQETLQEHFKNEKVKAAMAEEAKHEHHDLAEPTPQQQREIFLVEGLQVPTVCGWCRH